MARKQFNWHLPPEVETRLGVSTYGRQRAIYEAEHLLIILHGPPDPDEKERTPHVFLRKPNGSLWWNGLENGEAKLRSLLTAYGDTYEKHEHAYEHSQSAAALFEALEHLSPISRAAGNMRNALQEARDFVRDDPFLIAMRDEAYEMSRSYELLFTEVQHALDYRIALSSELQAAKAEELAVSQHKLNVLAAVTFPLMAIGTVFGMNLFHGLEGMGPALFWFVFAGGLVVGLLTMMWVIPADTDARAPEKQRLDMPERSATFPRQHSG